MNAVIIKDLPGDMANSIAFFCFMERRRVGLGPVDWVNWVDAFSM